MSTPVTSSSQKLNIYVWLLILVFTGLESCFSLQRQHEGLFILLS